LREQVSVYIDLHNGRTIVVNALSLLLGQLNQYIHQADGAPAGTSEVAVWGNIAQLDNTETANALENHLVLTLVNVEEEKTLKNSSTVSRDTSGGVGYQNPPLHLNLFLLFTANYRNYETGLKRLSQTMTFFQGKQKFTLGNSPGAGQNVKPIADISITMDLLSLSFEEVNHLWGSLGGKQMPFVVYRGRLITLRDRRLLDGGAPIREIDIVGRDATV
jgi:hypothetical protein